MIITRRSSGAASTIPPPTLLAATSPNLDLSSSRPRHARLTILRFFFRLASRRSLRFVSEQPHICCAVLRCIYVRDREPATLNLRGSSSDQVQARATVVPGFVPLRLAPRRCARCRAKALLPLLMRCSLLWCGCVEWSLVRDEPAFGLDTANLSVCTRTYVSLLYCCCTGQDSDLFIHGLTSTGTCTLRRAG